MTPKEKAEELIAHMRMPENVYQGEELAKKCALKAVDEILLFMDRFDLDIDMSIQFKWWKKVKQEIDNL